ncbi:hypothetical protein ID866_4063 [Astraeus odoratus]|nr:hypothetical protein ID866_4063 [Astraeus odoratus]
MVHASPAGPSGTGKVTVNFSAKLKTAGVTNIAEVDRARIRAFREENLGKRDVQPLVATNAQMAYTAQVGVGDPATEYTLLIDTGSSNTWVGACRPYTRTSSSHRTGSSVAVTYGSGGFSGYEYIDTISFENGFSIKEQSIGVADQSHGLADSGIDGILGIGPKDLTRGTTSNADYVSTVVDNLYSEGTISSAVVGVYFIPISDSSSGQLTFGGYDSSVITTPVNYVPITNTFPSSGFWGIDQSISYDEKEILPTSAGIVDTGTTLILIATDAFQTYQAATGGILDQETGLLTITQEQYDNLKPLSFIIGKKRYDLSANAQIWPRSLNSALGGSGDAIYLVVSDIGTSSGCGLDFVDGYTFLERYYSVYDTSNDRVGFASTAYTKSASN